MSLDTGRRAAVLRTDITVDVTGRVALDGPLALAATVACPPDIDPARPPVVLFAFPGGGYGRGYFDIEIAGHHGYSEVDHHVERGWIVVALDHLGVGDSSAPDPGKLTIDLLAAANDAAVRAVLERLGAGVLVDDLPPLRPARTIGAGQSMGGCLLIVTQGRHGTFDAVAPLGFSALHTELPTQPGTRTPATAGTNAPGAMPREIAAALTGTFAWAFHWDDVPADIVAADFGGGYPFRVGPVPPWASTTTPPAAALMLSPGVVADEAAAIDVPVFVGCGERDVVPDPRAEPTAYRGAGDITVVVVPRMAHMHNFAGTRRQLWRRLHGWGAQLAAR